MSLPKLLIVVSPFGEAMKRDVLESLPALRERFEVRVLAPKANAAAFARAGVPVSRWNPSGMIGVFFGIRALRRATKAFDPDVIAAHNFRAIALTLGTYPDRYASRTVALFHDPLLELELPRKLIQKRLGNDLRRAARLVAVNPTFARALEARFELEPGSIDVLPHGVSVPLGAAPLSRPPNRPGPVLGWNGRLIAERSWEVAIDALALLATELPDAKLLLSGTGSARQFVAGHARERKVGKRVEIRKELSSADLFAAIDILLVPNSLDAQPQILLEAAAWGVPVVAGNVGALADALRDFEAAWLVPDDAEGFAEGVRDAWSRIDSAWAAGMAQRQIARETYAREVTNARNIEFYESALKNERAPRELTKVAGS